METGGRLPWVLSSMLLLLSFVDLVDERRRVRASVPQMWRGRRPLVHNVSKLRGYVPSFRDEQALDNGEQSCRGAP